jgi:fatty-acyl-CoA synthase
VALLSHPGGALAAAVGRPDRHAGEVPVAYVSLHPPASAGEEELRAWAAGAVPETAAAPKDVHIVDSIPLTDVGKVFKPALRADVARRLVARELAAAGIPARVLPGAGIGPVEVEAPADDAVRSRVRDLLGGYSLGWEFADRAVATGSRWSDRKAPGR